MTRFYNFVRRNCSDPRLAVLKLRFFSRPFRVRKRKLEPFYRAFFTRFFSFRRRFRKTFPFLQRYPHYRLPFFRRQRRPRLTPYGQNLSARKVFKRFFAIARERTLFLRSKTLRRLPRSSGGLSGFELRLLPILVRSRLFSSSASIRQSIVHRHVRVNGFCVSDPLMILSPGDSITFSEQLLSNIKIRFSNFLRFVRRRYFRSIFRTTSGHFYFSPTRFSLHVLPNLNKALLTYPPGRASFSFAGSPLLPLSSLLILCL